MPAIALRELLAQVAERDLAVPRLDRRAARQVSRMAGRPVVWAEGLVDGLERTLGKSISRRPSDEENHSFAVRRRSPLQELAEVDRAVLRAARKEAAMRRPRDPVLGRLEFRASLRGPELVTVELDRALRRAEHRPWALEDAAGAFALAQAGIMAVWRLRDAVVAVARPEIDIEAGEPHAIDHPAVRWPHEQLWLWEGTWMDSDLASRRLELDAADVVGERNEERRRLLINAIGTERLFETSGAELVQQDDYGRLWWLEDLSEGEAFMVVELLNATEEADGSRRRYVLRVPAETRTARQAVAWTFGFEDAAAYDPHIQA